MPPTARVLRDIKARHGVSANEILRRAYLYVARNQTLPAQVRFQAQLQLNTFGRYTRPTTVKNRCTESGRGRGVIGEFGLTRVRACACFASLLRDGARIVSICGGKTEKADLGSILQYQFRLKALANELPGVHKASW